MTAARLTIADPERALLAARGLDSFEALWSAAGTSVEAGNAARGGSSTVARLEIAGPEGTRRLYLKRQRNFNCRTLRHWLGGIPVAQREWRAIQALARQGIATLEIAAYGRHHRRGDDRALLLTRALEGYQELDAWLRAHPDRADHRRLAEAAGTLIAALHGAGWRHGCLYPKHLFIAQDFPQRSAGNPLRLIDLEKCKRISRRHGGLRDLDTLFRHCPALDTGLREQLLTSYIRGLGLSLDTRQLAGQVARSKR